MYMANRNIQKNQLIKTFNKQDIPSKGTIKFIQKNKLGKGTYGVVHQFQCVQNSTNLNLKINQNYAIKQINEVNTCKNNIQREINAYKSMNSEYIVKTFGDFVIENTHNIIFELCKHQNLYQFYVQKISQNCESEQNQTKKEYLHENTVWKIFIQLCLGLYHLHQKNYIHRDLKSENVLLSKQNVVKIADLGFSINTSNTQQVKKQFPQINTQKQQNCILNDFEIPSNKFIGQYREEDINLLSSQILTSTQYSQQKIENYIVGTPSYISPEIINNKIYSKASDIWALGVILYELLNGYRPFDGQDIQDLFKNICNQKPRKMRLGISQDFTNILNGMLFKQHQKRIKLEEIIFSKKFKEMSQKLKIKLPQEINQDKSKQKSFLDKIQCNILKPRVSSKIKFKLDSKNDDLNFWKFQQLNKKQKILNELRFNTKLQITNQNYATKILKKYTTNWKEMSKNVKNHLLYKQNLETDNYLHSSITQFKTSSQIDFLNSQKSVKWQEFIDSSTQESKKQQTSTKQKQNKFFEDKTQKQLN